MEWWETTPRCSGVSGEHRHLPFIKRVRRSSETPLRDFIPFFLGGPAALRPNSDVQARFLLGPAGSGKTFRCVAEIRAELLRSPDGPPLIFLAPKQATFQLERQLLGWGESEFMQPLTRPSATLAPSDGESDEGSGGLRGRSPHLLNGYSRLHILSFERLAAFVFDQLEQPVPDLLSEEGRVMVLRALLAKHHAELKIFRASARLTGFATQLSLLLREFQRSRVTPASLATLAAKVPIAGRLNDKLHDLALLLDRYHAWLAARRDQGQNLDDANRLLDLATAALGQGTAAERKLKLGGLWLDGFAEMTPQETALLAALVPSCERATQAFCLDGEPREEISWLSPWTVVGRTFAQCREALAQSLHTTPAIEVLPREPSRSRFGSAIELATLERAWASGPSSSRREEAPSDNTQHATRNTQASQGLLTLAPAVRLVACPNAEAEATLAAREILRHVQAGGRFRECAMLVRSLDGYHDVLRRVLSRYDIPFFLDRREAVAHHPLAELTRYAVRTIAFDWRREDWFGALKTGLAGVEDGEVDWLENEALKRGWEGRVWREPLVVAEDAPLGERLEQIRQRVVPPFEQFATRMHAAGLQPAGLELAAAIRLLWRALGVEGKLEAWNEAAGQLGVSGAAHGTVWTQLNDWLDNLERAFAREVLPLREWLPILEAGLAGMTVGVIPPSLDQVLVGSVDRSRNPDLQIVFVLGMNEGVFPAPPTPRVLLTESDRLEIEAHGIVLGASRRQQIGHERYFGYIAFTRARRRLVVTWATADAKGRGLNPSSFVAAVKRAVPAAQEETYFPPDWTDAVHRVELPEHILATCSRGRESAAFEVRSAGEGLPTSAVTGTGIGELAGLEEFASVIRRWEQAREAVGAAHLGAGVAERLYGKELATSVSALEDFTGCPFHFLAARGLRAQEREEFVVDAREKGSFQHEVLEKFHERVRAGKRQWRDLMPPEARQWVREIGEASVKTFRGGLLDANEAARFAASVLIGNLERLLGTLMGWAQQYSFDPTEVEVSFGLPGAQLPPWRIALADGHVLKLRGRIDRVDLCRTDGGEALVVICDYKSSGRQMDPVKLEHGLELQLLSYLAALTRMPEAGVLFGVGRLKPAGVFYVPLRGKPGSGKTRAAADEASANAASAFQHRGRFDGAVLGQFDNRGVVKGEQFRFKVNNNGEFAKSGNEALPPGGFPALVDEAEAKLRAIGDAIFRGEAAVLPYRLKQRTACDLCAYRAVCRFDPWTMPFRRLECLASCRAANPICPSCL